MAAVSTPPAPARTTVPTTVELETTPAGVSGRRRRGRRGNHEGTIVKRKDGRWAGAVSIGPGKRKWVYGKTRAEAARALTSALKAHQDGIPTPRDSETVEHFLNRWLADTVTNRVRPVTLVSYTGLVRLHIIPDLGRVRLARLTPDQVQALLNRKLAAGASPRTVEYIRSVLRQALGHALRWNLVNRNVAALTDRPRPDRQEIRPLDPVEAERLLQHVRGDRLEALYVIALLLGLRQGEALGLRWDDVDLDKGFVQVRRSLTRIDGRFVLGEPKTPRSGRKLGPLPEALMDPLRAHRVRQTAERLAAPTWSEWGLVFASITGTPLHSSTVTKTFQRHLREAGLPAQRFHDLRHACGSYLTALGVHPRVVMEILGHSTIAVTMDTYSHVGEPTQRDAFARLSASLLS
jgi:integrase